MDHGSITHNGAYQALLAQGVVFPSLVQEVEGAVAEGGKTMPPTPPPTPHTHRPCGTAPHPRPHETPMSPHA
jgi:hypothetical protein